MQLEAVDRNKKTACYKSWLMFAVFLLLTSHTNTQMFIEDRPYMQWRVTFCGTPINYYAVSELWELSGIRVSVSQINASFLTKSQQDTENISSLLICFINYLQFIIFNQTSSCGQPRIFLIPWFSALKPWRRHDIDDDYFRHTAGE